MALSDYEALYVEPFLESGRPGQDYARRHLSSNATSRPRYTPRTAGVSVFGRVVYLGLRLSGSKPEEGSQCLRDSVRSFFGQRDAFFFVLASGVGIPFSSISVAFAIRVRRVSSLLASLIQRQYSLR